MAAVSLARASLQLVPASFTSSSYATSPPVFGFLCLRFGIWYLYSSLFIYLFGQVETRRAHPHTHTTHTHTRSSSLNSLVEDGNEMIVGSRRKQRGAQRTHDSAGEAPPQTNKTQGRGGWVTENCGRQRLSQSRWRTGEDTSKLEGPSETQSLRRDVHHWDEIGRSA